VFDMNAVAKESGTIVSAVMLGAIAGSGILPFAREQYEEVVRRPGPSADASLRGFARAYEIVSGARAQEAFVSQVLGNDREEATIDVPVALSFPEPVRDILRLGHARLLDYQGPAYANLYVTRLQQVLAAEQHADPDGEHAFETTRETARWLALWMAFDDIVRVADLKSRASRWQRVQREVKAGENDLLAVYDHFKPGVPEFAALLPERLAARLIAWDRRRVARGRAPWALALKVGTHTAFGMLALRALSSLKWLRVRGSRWKAEQRMIEQWLAAVVEGTRRHAQLGREVALCGRLIKGYGATNERGKDNLLHVLAELAAGDDAQAAAKAVAAAREAALADDAGKALDAELVRQGAKPRPVKAQPIRFIPRTMKETSR
jgi:indolepyruvate ferredoxin oxidoreductase beta subunit